MEKKFAIKVFKDKNVRTILEGTEEKWYFSIIDIIDNSFVQKALQKKELLSSITDKLK